MIGIVVRGVLCSLCPEPCRVCRGEVEGAILIITPCTRCAHQSYGIVSEGNGSRSETGSAGCFPCPLCNVKNCSPPPLQIHKSIEQSDHTDYHDFLWPHPTALSQIPTPLKPRSGLDRNTDRTLQERSERSRTVLHHRNPPVSAYSSTYKVIFRRLALLQ